MSSTDGSSLMNFAGVWKYFDQRYPGYVLEIGVHVPPTLRSRAVL